MHTRRRRWIIQMVGIVATIASLIWGAGGLGVSGDSLTAVSVAAAVVAVGGWIVWYERDDVEHGP